MPQGPFNTLVAKLAGLNTYSWLNMGKQGDLLMSDFHGTKYNQAYNGNLFYGSNQVGATLSNALATTYTGLCLSNPAGSGKNLSLRQVSGIIIVAPAGIQPLGLITGYAAGGVTVHTTALTPKPATINSAAASVAKLDAAATIVGTPAWDRWFATSTASTNEPSFTIDIQGGLLIPPGGYAAIGSFGAAGPTAGLLGTFEWEEIAP